MRTYKLIAAMIMVLAFSAMAVATASAAETLWRWLPGSAKETFKGTAGPGTLQESKEGTKGGSAIKCQKSEILLTDSALKASSELLENEAKLALAIVHFSSCKAFGLAANR